MRAGSVAARFARCAAGLRTWPGWWVRLRKCPACGRGLQPTAFRKVSAGSACTLAVGDPATAGSGRGSLLTMRPEVAAHRRLALPDRATILARVKPLVTWRSA